MRPLDWPEAGPLRILEFTLPCDPSREARSFGGTVMGEEDDPPKKLESTFVEDTKRPASGVPERKDEPTRVLPKEHRDNRTAETRSLDSSYTRVGRERSYRSL